MLKYCKNRSAANRLKVRILEGISLLKDNPYMGTPLSSKYDGVPDDIRFLVISKQMVFYKVVENRIEIIRVLDGRTDYLVQFVWVGRAGMNRRQELRG